MTKVAIFMKWILTVTLPIALLLTAGCGKENALQKVETWEKKGDFSKAEKFIQKYLKKEKNLPDSTRQALLWQLDWMHRVRLDYPYTKSDIVEQLKKRVTHFKKKEFETWLKEGRFDARTIDGKQYFLYASVSNLFKRYKDLRDREVPPKKRAAYEQAFWKNYANMVVASQGTPDRTVYPQDYRMTMTVTVKPNAVPAGEIIRAWLPYPRVYPFQGDIHFIQASSTPIWIDQPESPIRSVYLEQPAVQDSPTVFFIQYTYRMYSVISHADPSKIQPYRKNTCTYREFTREQPPHVIFTKELVDLAHQIVGKETNPLKQAKLLYLWIGKNIQYSYANEYSTIPNISMYTYSHRYGDCGQEALLFITLARILGIPARWQSGWYVMPEAETIHDWAEAYFEPYGWIPVEPYMAIWINQYAATFSPEQKQSLTDFYFGGIDHFRLIFNAVHGQKLFPPKKYFRSDNVDFQRGEVEWKGGNLYFDQWSYDLKVELLPEAVK